MGRPGVDPGVKRAVRDNFDLSVEEYRAYEAETGRFEALARRLRDAMADRGATFVAVLDAGAGSGSSTAVFAEAGAVVALDVSRGMLSANPAARRVVGDLEALPFGDDRFDVVAFTASLFLVPDPERAAREARRVLRPDGIVGAVAPIGWFSGNANVFDILPRQSRSPRSVDDVRSALEAVFAVETGVWSFESTAAEFRAFFDIPAAAARLYPKLPPAERRRRARTLLADVAGQVEHRWRWFIGR